MTDMQPKKMIILDILQIIQKHSDKDHRLSQRDIQKLLEIEYGMKVDRKTISRNIITLAQCNYPIEYGSNGDETIMTNICYDHKFLNGELRLLIDSVLLTDGLSKKERISLIRRIEGLSSKYFHSEISKIDMDIYGRIENKQIILTLEEIGSAIAEGTQVTFHYHDCGMDGELHPRLESNCKKKQYTVNPYQIISKNGHSYLICNLPEHLDLTHFRIDRIKDCHKTDVPSRSLRMLKGFETGIRLSEYIKSHPDLWSGTLTHITFQCKRYMMNDVADNFGTDLNIEELPDDMMKVHVDASESSMLHWAVRFSDAVEVLSPVNLRKMIAETLRNALKKYEV
ncbi:MAG: WYL domain-containing protein [Ruminococcus sp.]|nr:WYL domain-containing protein [Ruminococcus sp.]